MRAGAASAVVASGQFDVGAASATGRRTRPSLDRCDEGDAASAGPMPGRCREERRGRNHHAHVRTRRCDVQCRRDTHGGRGACPSSGVLDVIIRYFMVLYPRLSRGEWRLHTVESRGGTSHAGDMITGVVRLGSCKERTSVGIYVQM